ncbi:ejaculatory bulb-specific protein 3 [Plutella xylostella]|uniref:ejaculatory bulb-specific protein 3 n=1 Tax=Plutella xylostella TaxID=51655 RepID=UPI0020324002|nr:ejaculatory bulb-specific protein 3 [Plutella xylostella]XP_048483634.1 ejaculatory bulb-specific protein 3 [Plutella xylostella]
MQLLLLLVISAPLVLGYDAKYDQLDVDKILADDDTFSAYVNCLLDKGPCSVEHSEDFKTIFPEVVATACEKCSDLQKANVRKSVKALQDRRPEDFKALRTKYDPKGDYEEKFLRFILGN